MEVYPHYYSFCAVVFNNIHTACRFVIIILVAKWILIDHVKLDAFRTNAILPELATPEWPMHEPGS